MPVGQNYASGSRRPKILSAEEAASRQADSKRLSRARQRERARASQGIGEASILKVQIYTPKPATRQEVDDNAGNQEYEVLRVGDASSCVASRVPPNAPRPLRFQNKQTQALPSSSERDTELAQTHCRVPPPLWHSSPRPTHGAGANSSDDEALAALLQPCTISPDAYTPVVAPDTPPLRALPLPTAARFTPDSDVLVYGSSNCSPSAPLLPAGFSSDDNLLEDDTSVDEPLYLRRQPTVPAEIYQQEEQSNVEHARVDHTGTPALETARQDDATEEDLAAVEIQVLQRNAVQTIVRCLQHGCNCSRPVQPEGHTLAAMAQLIQGKVAASDMLRTIPDAPLSLPRALHQYRAVSLWPDWEALLTGHNLDPRKPSAPPVLDFDASEAGHKATLDSVRMSDEFDIDSVLFKATSLAAFTQNVEYSFRPSYVRTKQQDQRVSIPGTDMTHDKCLLLCMDGRWECYAFFPQMPPTYTSPDGTVVPSKTQHLDDYCLEIWTDQILLPALDAVCSLGRRHHYPFSFQEVKTKANVKSEILVETSVQTRVDVRIPMAANLLGPLWSKIIELAADVPNTCLASEAFSDAVLLIANHNLKLGDVSKREDFASVRQAFVSDFQSRWDPRHIELDHTWIDLGHERCGLDGCTTLLRKASCNQHWADRFVDPQTQDAKSVQVVTFPWASTSAGSVTAMTKGFNSLRHGGIAYSKAYNVNKELFASQMKGHTPFQDPLFEVLSYSEELLQSWASLHRGSYSSAQSAKLSRALLLRHWQSTKERLYSAIHGSQNARFGDRQEFRITYAILLALPEELSEMVRGSLEAMESQPDLHNGSWYLATKDVNEFRIAECNRWILALEQAVQAAEYVVGTKETLPVAEQELNSLLTTAVARMLRLSLGCLDPQQIPSLWLGKRWVKSRFQNEFRNNVLMAKRGLQRRHGLDLQNAVQRYNMAWIPHKLAVWSTCVPLFRVDRYRNLDIGVNSLRATLQVSAVRIQDLTKEGKLREYVRMRLRQAHEQPESGHTALVTVLVQMCVQAYNKYVWRVVKERWRKTPGNHQASDEAFIQAAGLHSAAVQGLEILHYDMLEDYLCYNLGLDNLAIAFAKTSKAAKHYPSWSSGLWCDRLAPLFQPISEQPNWASKTEFSKKYEEILALVQEIVPTLAERFKTRLQQDTGRYLQAILHYEWDKGSTLAKSLPGNSVSTQLQRQQASELARTKWMFPRLSDADYVYLGLDQNGTQLEDRITPSLFRERVVRWEVLTEKDSRCCSPSTRNRKMVASGFVLGGLETLAYLERFLGEFEAWLLEQDAGSRPGEEDSGDDTDWPSRPGSPESSDGEASGAWEEEDSTN